MKIQSKLLLSFALIALICAIVGIVGWRGITNINGNVKELTNNSLPKLEGIATTLENLNAVKGGERTMLNRRISHKERESEASKNMKRMEELEKGWKLYLSAERGQEEKAKAEKVSAALAAWKADDAKLLALVRSIRTEEGADNTAVMDQMFTLAFGELRASFGAAEKELGELAETTTAEANAVALKADKTASTSVAWALTAMLLGVIAAIALGFFIARQIAQPLRQAILTLEKISLGDTSTAATLSMGTAVDCSKHKNCGKKDCPSFGKEDHCWVTSGSMAVIKHCPRAAKGEDCRSCALFGAKTETEELASIINGMTNSQKERVQLAEAIADGDLTHPVAIASDKDGLGKALQHMQQSLLNVISQTKLAGNEIASGALQIADSSQSMAQGASEQASSLEEISSAMTEMSSQTKMTADNAHKAQELSHSASSAAIDGNRQMQNMVGAMEEIRVASQSVANVIKVIEEIAFQTNMLALNAAVEAAHAGQHGKGFAVVAEEVRNLAARSAKAAKETADLIAGSVAKTENGAKIADQTAASLAEITNRIAQASELVKGIAEAALEQSQGIDQVSQGLHQIDQVTQQNSANAEQGAAASEELSGQAAQLNQLMQNFKVADSGQAEGGLGKPPLRQLGR
ncbi:MAG: hypothetical protein HGA96_08910 [Desulfobulbaceae bacterium]|nr:hypothetical protein [Desulfobulbaceae bacterium]